MRVLDYDSSMQIAEEQIVDKIRALSDEERADVLRYVERVLRRHDRPATLGERISQIVADVPDEIWDRVPTDGAEQHDHYIYGTRKR
ncbi:MAG TPA: hypothetical protein PLK77_11690 [Pyrinomonadaceae bacterium]|nr:hypothetical protein [Pyrinomonadaceae bacterium]